MTILQVVKDVCAVVGVNLPASLFAPSANPGIRTMQEMLALANEMAQRIAYDTREWTKLKKQATFTGTAVRVDVADPGDPPEWEWQGGAEGFALPADYQRMLRTANVWRSTSTQQPMTFISDTDEWLRRRAENVSNAWGEWTLLGDQMLIWPIMHGAWDDPGTLTNPDIPVETAKFAYLERNCVVLNGGGYGDRFVNDADSYRLDERLLKLGMIWQWKAQKGSPFAEDMGTYSDALANVTGADKPSPIIIDRLPASSFARVGAPWPADWGPQP